MSELGLYRIRRHDEENLLYVGQGRIGGRVRAHFAKRARADHRKAPRFTSNLDVSWVVLNAVKRALLEVENDAIVSHRLVCGFAPHAQVIG